MNLKCHVSHSCDVRDHMEAESSLANLFSGQITRLTRQMSGRFIMITVLSDVYCILFYCRRPAEQGEEVRSWWPVWTASPRHQAACGSH